MGAAPSLLALVPSPILAAGLMPAPPPLQEMLAIMKSIYDMMGRHTYPLLREDAPLEHVERFFQVSAPAGCAAGRGRGSCWASHPEPPLPQEGKWPCLVS